MLDIDYKQNDRISMITSLSSNQLLLYFYIISNTSKHFTRTSQTMLADTSPYKQVEV